MEEEQQGPGPVAGDARGDADDLDDAGDVKRLMAMFRKVVMA